MERRLAAILAADVVGFSRLMELDEAGTLSQLKARRTQVLEPMVAKHRGRIFKITGDGVLIEFASAVNAVECAVALQRAFAAANEAGPMDRQIVLRIGVNLGDVMVEGGDLYGEGVNIAARLESLAEPGGVLLSGTAHEHVKNKSQLNFADLGSRSLKNIAEPVRVFRVAGQDAPQPRKAASAPEKPTIAVLPFTNMSGDPAQQYFSDGMTEDILTALSRFRLISVIARHSSFQFRDGKADIRQVGRELGAGYVLEGSVRRAGEIIRITAQLIEVETGNHLWAERYDRPASDLFTVQDEIVSTIAGTLFPKLEDAGAQIAKRKHPESLAAYDYLLRGWELQQKSTQADLRPARDMLEKAIAIDPELASAYTYLALVDQALWDVEGEPALLERALENAQRAVELDEEEATGHCILGYVCLMMHQFERAEFHQQRSVTLNPNNANMLAHMGLLKAYLGETKEAVKWLKQAMTINLSPPDWYREYIGFALFCNREYDEAAKNFNSNLGDLPWGRIYAVASYAQLGRTNDAKAQLGLLETRLRGRSLQDYLIGEPFKNPSDLEHLLEALRKAGVAIELPAARGA